jgi:hypothetical protein
MTPARATFAIVCALSLGACDQQVAPEEETAERKPPTCKVTDGQCIFRYDTFGDEQLWTDVLRLHELVQELPPTDALALGLKVDADAVPPDVLASADLSAPETTVALLELNAIVGVRARVEDGKVESIGITCALCHSTVDDSVAPGIGARLDGWPARDLNPGAIIAATPGLADYVATLGVDVETARTALMSWGPGRYDARFNQDLMSAPVLIPPAYGLADVALETYTGEGPISYWNAYVAVTQMGAHGTFIDRELGIEIIQKPDLVTKKLPALRDYQFSLEAPPPPEGSFDEHAAERGRLVFEGVGRCATCHSGASRQRRSAPIRPRPSAARPASIARRRYVVRGSTRRTSTTGAQPRSTTWWRTTTCCSGSSCPKATTPTSWHTSPRSDRWCARRRSPPGRRGSA